MAGTFSLEIVTPAQAVYNGEVAEFQAPGLDGYFGVLHNRAPLISALGPGQLKFKDAEGLTRYLVISGGFFQVLRNKAIVLADAAEFAEDIDAAAAAAAEQAARDRLSGVLSDAERTRRQRVLAFAKARVKVAGQARR
ncbi:MAG: ATP synthase F1 subunit epsilon [Fimbriimonadaceae bacterium]|nr:ATP synthase F1 subunit epsilon [Fimbriimonadaceae bacterium]